MTHFLLLMGWGSSVPLWYLILLAKCKFMTRLSGIPFGKELQLFLCLKHPFKELNFLQRCWEQDIVLRRCSCTHLPLFCFWRKISWRNQCSPITGSFLDHLVLGFVPRCWLGLGKHPSQPPRGYSTWCEHNRQELQPHFPQTLHRNLGSRITPHCDGNWRALCHTVILHTRLVPLGTKSVEWLCGKIYRKKSV